MIVGGGAAGTLAAIELLNRCAAREVVLVERSGALGEGVAYSTRDDRHLLNLPAAAMSVPAGDPGHFGRWLGQSSRSEVDPGSFVPRRRYGEYLRAMLARAASRQGGAVRLEIIRAAALAARSHPAGAEIELGDGRTLAARCAVIAIGQLSAYAPWSGASGLSRSERYVADPWRPGALDRVGAGDRVVLAGSGLTMADVAISLAGRGTRLLAVSRHGLTPLAHARTPAPGLAREWAPGGRLVDLARALRREAETADDWRSVVDSVRPQAQELWRSLSLEGQEQFMRHARRYWEAHRHRMAPEAARELERLIADGRLALRAGTILTVREGPDALEISFRPRSGTRRETLSASFLVNCTGTIDAAPQPLVVSLLRQGLARPDAHRLGLAVTGEGELLGARGAQESLIALGALRRGTLWETTAIAEIHAQAVSLAALLVRRRVAAS